MLAARAVAVTAAVALASLFALSPGARAAPFRSDWNCAQAPDGTA